MTILRNALALFVIPIWIFANSTAPFPADRALLNQLCALTEVQVSSALALETLEKISEGQIDFVNDETAASLGLSRGLISAARYLRNSTVRAYALRRIGDSSLKTALAYLQGIKPGSLGPDPSGELYPAAEIARYSSLVIHTPNTQGQIELLESALSGEGHLALWAANTLCDRGSMTSLPPIQAALRQMDPERSRKQIQFCEARVHILTSGPDKIQALASVLKVSPVPDSQLLNWAISQLANAHSAEAERHLARFYAEVENIPETGRDAVLWLGKESIRYSRPDLIK